MNGREVRAALGAVAESAVRVGGEYEGILFAGAYSDLALRGDVPHLLSRAGDKPAGWRAIALKSARVSGGPEPPNMPFPQRRDTTPSRNDPCPCGSGRKYKHCCGR